MDAFQTIRNMEMVKRVSNFYPEVWQKPIDFLFFVCPPNKNRPKLNRHKNGFTFCYRKGAGLDRLNQERVQKVQSFLNAFQLAGIAFNCRCIFAAGDALIVSPIPLEKPDYLLKIEGIPVVSNYELVCSNLGRFAALYNKKPWETVPSKVTKEEKERLFQILPTEADENIKMDFVERVWAGFALDGILMKKGAFGSNPVILGVESFGVTILQNSALSKKDWIPVIGL